MPDNPARPSYLAAAEARLAAVRFPYQMEHWGWRAGLIARPAEAQAQALANEAMAAAKAAQARRMQYDPTEVACYRSTDWYERALRWDEEAAFWAAVAREAEHEASIRIAERNLEMAMDWDGGDDRDDREAA